MNDELPVLFEVISLVAVVAILVVDLVLVRRRPHVPSTREAVTWIGVYVALALVFCGLLWALGGGQPAQEFLAGWLTEYSLSLDNLFVFVLIMGRFAVPKEQQQRVLMVGIIVALLLRGGFILAGSAVIEHFTWVFYLFGAFLVYTAVQLVRGSDDDEEYHDNLVVRWAGKVVPLTTDYHGGALRTEVAGKRVFTPLVVVFVAIGTTDVLFAFDSIPAIFGLTQDPFLVFTANVFALMGLRQLYFLLGGLIDRLDYLPLGLAAVLAFIGVDLVLEALHTNSVPFINGGEPLEGVPSVPIWLSLTAIVVLLGTATIASLVKIRREARQKTPADAS